jgi:transposase
MASADPARVKKKALDENYTIAYLDEAAFSHFPYVQKTFHRKGQRCVVTHGPLRGGVQTISMITSTGRLYFYVKQGSITSADVVTFLSELLKRFKRKKLLIILDGAAIHRSKEIKVFLKEKARGRIHLVRLPPYSPQLNADEQVHGLLKTRDFKNRLFVTTEALETHVIQSFKNLAARPNIITNFFKHKEVGFYST